MNFKRNNSFFILIAVLKPLTTLHKSPASVNITPQPQTKLLTGPKS